MFGIDLFDASLVPALFVAVLAGALSFVSPCVLPVVPPYLAYISGISFPELMEGRARGNVVQSAAMFVIGLSTVFILLGLAASALGSLFLQHQVLLGRVAGGVIVVFGLHFVGIIRIPILDNEARFNVSGGGGMVGAYVLGLAFAFGWAPCIGPQLGAILSLASQEESVVRGAFLLAFYAAGLGIPFMLAAVFIGRSIRIMNSLKPHMKLIERSIGGLLLAVGLLLVFGQFSAISYWILETFPALAVVG